MKRKLGIEIGKKTLKLAVAGRKAGQYQLAECFVEALSLENEDGIAAQINGILAEKHYRAETVALSLPRNLLTVRTIHLPSKDNAEISRMIELYVGRIVPFKREEIFLSYDFCGEDDLGYSMVIVAIAHVDMMRRHMRIVEKAGFLIDKVTLSSYGAWQWVLAAYKNEISRLNLYAILDLGGSFCDFIIAGDKSIRFTRNINMEISEIMTDEGKTKFIGELKQSLAIFYNEEANKKPDRLYAGAGFDPDFCLLIQKELGLPVVSVPGPRLSAVGHGSKIAEAGVGCAALAGVVLDNNPSSFSFIVPEIQVQKEARKKIKELVVLGSLIMGIVGLICLIFIGRAYNDNCYLGKLRSKDQDVRSDIGDLSSHIDTMAMAKERLSVRRLPFLAVYMLQKTISPNISLEYIGLDESGKVTVRGQAVQLADVFTFESGLKGVKYFKDVASRGTMKKMAGDKEVTGFEINFSLNTDDGDKNKDK